MPTQTWKEAEAFLNAKFPVEKEKNISFRIQSIEMPFDELVGLLEEYKADYGLKEENETLNSLMKSGEQRGAEKGRTESAVRIQELEQGLRGMSERYVMYRENLLWHIKTNNPTGEQLKAIEERLTDINEVVRSLSSLLNSQQTANDIKKDKTESHE